VKLKSKLENKEREKQEMTKEGKDTYPAATSLCFLRRGIDDPQV
jgi:hypothetical protein